MQMVGFGRKTAWLAVREGVADEVFTAMGAQPLKEVDWRSGLDRCYVSPDLVVATPALPGADGRPWLLVTGRWLLLNEIRISPVELSSQLDTEVQYFATHRVSEYHRWTRAVKGVLVRSFAHLGETGETLVWLGDPDEVELAAGLPPTPPGEDDSLLVGEDDVMRVAGAWSLDPTALDGQIAPGPLRLAELPAGQM